MIPPPTMPAQRLITHDTCKDESLIDLSDEKCKVEQPHQPEWINMFGQSPSPPSQPQQDEGDADTDNDWYRRNSTALEEPRQIRKLIIPQPRVGLDFVRALQDATQTKKTNDITGKRRERKSVLPKETWADVQGQLEARGIHLESREKPGEADGRTKATVTYYGTSAVFYNHQVRTKIRMRIRYYVSYEKSNDGTISNVRREGATKDKGFLELKVKSPRAYDENSVDKYRLLVSDHLVAQLVNLDPTEATFLNELDLVKQSIERESKDDQATLINTVFHVIGTLAKRKSAFIRPSLVVSYERSAYKYIEKDYPIPSTERSGKRDHSLFRLSSKKASNKAPRTDSMFRWRRRRGRPSIAVVDKLQESTETASSGEHDDSETHQLLNMDGIFNSKELSLETPLIDPSPNENVKLHDIEYQFTIDKDVRAHYALLPLKGATRMPVAEHLYAANKSELMRYPSEARVVEFKEPLAVATLPEKDRSTTHNSLVHLLVDRMQAEIMWGDYDENVGKYGNFRSRLMAEHRTNRIKNEKIQIDFSGTGKYAQNSACTQ